jgi:acetyltransferase EpsM
MKYNNIFIFGVGGHARVILSELLLLDDHKSIVFVANDDCLVDSITINDINYTVINNMSELKNLYDKGSCGIIGIGSIEKRMLICEEVSSTISNFSWMRLLSKHAIISEDVKIGEGTVVISGSLINTGTTIGKHCIINTKASIDHDNTIGDFINISPTVVTGGSVKIGNNSDIGIGSTISNNIDIRHNVIIGGHSFVNKDCESNSLYFGSPIKKIK